MNFHEPIKKLANFYAESLNDSAVQAIINSQQIENEHQAKQLLGFCEQMFDLSIEYEEKGKNVLGEPAKVYDVEKVYSFLHDFISEQGYDYLIEE